MGKLARGLETSYFWGEATPVLCLTVAVPFLFSPCISFSKHHTSNIFLVVRSLFYVSQKEEGDMYEVIRKVTPIPNGLTYLNDTTNIKDRSK